MFSCKIDCSPVHSGSMPKSAKRYWKRNGGVGKTCSCWKSGLLCTPFCSFSLSESCTMQSVWMRMKTLLWMIILERQVPVLMSWNEVIPQYSTTSFIIINIENKNILTTFVHNLYINYFSCKKSYLLKTNFWISHFMWKLLENQKSVTRASCENSIQYWIFSFFQKPNFQLVQNAVKNIITI